MKLQDEIIQHNFQKLYWIGTLLASLLTCTDPVIAKTLPTSIGPTALLIIDLVSVVAQNAVTENNIPT